MPAVRKPRAKPTPPVETPETGLPPMETPESPAPAPESAPAGDDVPTGHRLEGTVQCPNCGYRVDLP